MSETQRIELTVIGNIDKSGSIPLAGDNQTILQALQDHIAVESVSFRLNGAAAKGEDVVKDGDRVTAVPKVKAGSFLSTLHQIWSDCCWTMRG